MAIVRANSNAYENGEQYLIALQGETSKNFAILLTLLSSYWKSDVDGPYYARSMKAMAIAISQLRLSLDNIYNDSEYALTRGEFLNQVVTNLVFPDTPTDLPYSDIEFRDFLVQLINIYFKGSVPDSVQQAVSLVVGKDVVLHINYEDSRNPSSGLDISDQFGFSIDVALSSPADIDLFVSDRNIRIILQILRPAHTLYTIRYILSDEYLGNNALPYVGPRPPHKVEDSLVMNLSDYKYEDFRKYVLGVYGVDEDGFKKSYSAIAEDHSSSF
jgi:hypothetical protein